MVLLQPVDRAGDQEAAYLVAAEIVNRSVPVPMNTLARIAMFVQRRAVEAVQPVRISWKVRRHPIDDHADAGQMRAVDEMGEAVRRSQPRGGSKQAKWLVAPRTAERMFCDRHELNMREAKIGDVG